MKRRDAIRAAMSAAALAGTSSFAAGRASARADYPNRPVRLVVPFGAGGFSDIVGRLVTERLSVKWGVPIVVDNKPGGGSMLGSDVVAKSAPDGYTLLLSSIVTHAIGPSLHKTLPFDPVKDLAPVSLLVATPNLLVANNDLPAKTVGDLIALAKAKPDSLNAGSPGNGTTGHLSGALFSSMAGVKLTYVQYRGSPQVLTDLMAGTIQIACDNAIFYAPHVTSGKVKALAVTGRQRSALVPDVPTVSESGLPGYEASSWFAIAAPGGTPTDIIDRINADIQPILKDPTFLERVKGAEILGGTPADYVKFAASEHAKWSKVVDSVGLRAE